MNANTKIHFIFYGIVIATYSNLYTKYTPKYTKYIYIYTKYIQDIYKTVGGGWLAGPARGPETGTGPGPSQQIKNIAIILHFDAISYILLIKNLKNHLIQLNLI